VGDDKVGAVTGDEFHVGEARRSRLDRYQMVAKSLSQLSRRQLRDVVENAQSLGRGIGGTTSLLDVMGSPVLVKRVPLTDLERQANNVMSTANLFELPLGCQYGVGSPGFGVWRELAANRMTTSWVLAGRTSGFPLMYHWRVLDGPAAGPLVDELADVERTVAYWHGASGVRRRIEAIRRSSATVTLFLEYLPYALTDWLGPRILSGDGSANSAIAMVEQNLRNTVAFMNSSGLFHFDAHFGNMLTDGQRLCLTDFGLATSPRFDLSAAEADFLAVNMSHDACHSVSRLVDWLVTELTDVADWEARDEFIRRCATGEDLAGRLPSAAAEIIERYAPIAVVINGFYRQLHLEDRTTPYPVAEIERVRHACGLDTL
jgi:hypothetical protein